MKKKDKLRLRMKQKRLQKPVVNDLTKLVLSCKDLSNTLVIGIVLLKISNMAIEPGMDIYLLKKEIDKALDGLNELNPLFLESNIKLLTDY